MKSILSRLTVVVIIIFSSNLLMSFKSDTILRSSNQTKKQWIKADATITEIKKQPLSTRLGLDLKVSYKTEEGKQIDASCSIEPKLRQMKLKVGDVIQIKYHQEEPN